MSHAQDFCCQCFSGLSEPCACVCAQETPCTDANCQSLCSDPLATANTCRPSTCVIRDNCTVDGVVCSDCDTPTPTVTPTATATPTNTPLPDGAPCTADGQCASEMCVDDVCCNEPCTGPDQLCNLQGSVGTCTDLAAPAPTTSRTGLLIGLGILAAIAAVALWRRRELKHYLWSV